jgi:uncharacterized protein (TIGR00266 family)
MNVDVQFRPAYALAKVRLDPGEDVVVEAGAMVGMSSGLELETKARGGFLKSMTRSMFGGESFFMNRYHAPAGGDVFLAPALPGDIEVIEMAGEEMLVQSGGFLASSSTIDIETKWGGAKTFFASEGLILLRASGTGKMIIASYGAIDKISLGPGETFTVDTGHLVTFSPTMEFKVRKVGGWKSTFLSGEGLVVDLTGPGEATLQSRSQDAFLSWLIPQLPSQASRAD